MIPERAREPPPDREITPGPVPVPVPTPTSRPAEPGPAVRVPGVERVDTEKLWDELFGSEGADADKAQRAGVVRGAGQKLVRRKRKRQPEECVGEVVGYRVEPPAKRRGGRGVAEDWVKALDAYCAVVDGQSLGDNVNMGPNEGQQLAQGQCHGSNTLGVRGQGPECRKKIWLECKKAVDEVYESKANISRDVIKVSEQNAHGRNELWADVFVLVGDQVGYVDSASIGAQVGQRTAAG